MVWMGVPQACHEVVKKVSSLEKKWVIGRLLQEVLFRKAEAQMDLQ